MANTRFVVNSYRYDPYKNFKFRIKWDGKTVCGVSKISPLKQSTTPVEHREGGDPSTSRKTPSVWKYDAITLERGVTHDREFEKWAQKVWNSVGPADGVISLKDFRKDITIELLNEQGAVAKAYNVYNCWVSEYQALPDLDANANAVAIEMLKLEHEGFELDRSITEPEEEEIVIE